MTTLPLFVGVDIGGTKIAAAIVDASAAVGQRLCVPTPRGGADEVLAAVIDLVGRLRAECEVVAVGVGAPGVIDARHGVVLSATDVLPGWSGTRVAEVLHCAFHLPVFVDNDVRLAAGGEVRHHVELSGADVLFVSVGTGIGGALVDNGLVRRGPHGSAGEIAHLLVPAVGAIACGCGRSDHLEAVASGPGIAAAYARLAGGDQVTLIEVAGRARAGDAHADVAIETAASLLGRALSGLASVIDIDAIIIGGGVANLGALLLKPLTAAFRAEALPTLREVPIVRAALGADGPLLGAARHAQLATSTTLVGTA